MIILPPWLHKQFEEEMKVEKTTLSMYDWLIEKAAKELIDYAIKRDKEAPK